MPGITRRLVGDLKDEPLERNVARQRSGGIRRRFCDAAPAASSTDAVPSGGVRQRLGSPLRSSSSTSCVDYSLPLNKKLRQEFARGHLSALTTLELSSAAGEQGTPDLGRLQKRKIDPKHAHEQLIAALGYPKGSPEVEYIMVDGKKKKKAQPIICPVDLYEASMQVPTKRALMLGEAGETAAFWHGFRTHPACPADVDPSDVALGLHADGARTTGADGLFAIAWNSLHNRSSTRTSRMLFATIRKKDDVGNALTKMFDRFAWSMNCLAEGVIADMDWQGKPHPHAGRRIVGGRKAKCVQIRGVCEFYRRCLHFPTLDGVPMMCWLCFASPFRENCWTRCDEGAPWRENRQTHEWYLQWLADNNSEIRGIFQILYLNIFSVCIDVLHTLDLGVCSHVIGNIMIECCAPGILPGSTQEARMEVMNDLLQDWYKANPGTYTIDGPLTYVRC